MIVQRIWAKSIVGIVLGGLCSTLAFAQQPGQQQRSAVSAQGATGSRNAPQSHGPGMADDVIVQYDQETGSLIVVTDEETNSHIKPVIDALDQPVPQVLINVLFLEATHGNNLDLGTEFSAGYKKTKTTGTTTTTTQQNAVQTLFDIAGETTGGFYRLIKDNLSVTLRAMAENSQLEVLSRPSILTRNNQQASVTVGKEVPFIRNTRILQDGQQLNTVEYEDIGIILQVTPHIRPDGLVDMDLLPEISTTTGETVPITAGVTAPVFAKRSAQTGVVVPTGQTVVIGGLMEDNKTVDNRKIPFLGDIPLLGLAFHRKVTSKTKTELLIFLTPYIIPTPGALSNVTSVERSRAELAPQVFTEQQLQRYTDPALPPLKSGVGPDGGASSPKEGENAASTSSQKSRKGAKTKGDYSVGSDWHK